MPKKTIKELEEAFLKASDDFVDCSMNLTVAIPSRVSTAALAVEVSVRKYRTALMEYFTASRLREKG